MQGREEKKIISSFFLEGGKINTWKCSKIFSLFVDNQSLFLSIVIALKKINSRLSLTSLLSFIKSGKSFYFSKYIYFLSNYYRDTFKKFEWKFEETKQLSREND